MWTIIQFLSKSMIPCAIIVFTLFLCAICRLFAWGGEKLIQSYPPLIHQLFTTYPPSYPPLAKKFQPGRPNEDEGAF